MKIYIIMFHVPYECEIIKLVTTDKEEAINKIKECWSNQDYDYYTLEVFTDGNSESDYSIYKSDGIELFEGIKSRAFFNLFKRIEEIERIEERV